MTRFQQLKRHRTLNERRKIIEEARENYIQRKLAQKPMSFVQEIRKSVLLNSFFGNVRS